MSRRIKPTAERLVAPVPMSKEEYGLKNYLHLNNIYRDNDDMQTIIINSFYCSGVGENDDDWKLKVNRVHGQFSKFCSYAQNNWKPKQIAP